MNNQSGISLVQTLISVGLAGAIALGLVRMQKNAQKSQNTILKNYETLQIITAAENALRDKASCMETISRAGGTVADDMNQIWRKTATGERVVLETNKEYLGQGQGGKVVVEAINFERDNSGNPVFKVPPVQLGATSNYQVLMDLNIAIDKSNSGDRDISKGLGAQKIIRKLRDFSLVVDASDGDGNFFNDPVVDCYSPEDQYVRAACTALGGDINPVSGKCDNLEVNQLTATGSLIAETTINLANCLEIRQGMGPGGKPGPIYNTTDSW